MAKRESGPAAKPRLKKAAAVKTPLKKAVKKKPPEEKAGVKKKQAASQQHDPVMLEYLLAELPSSQHRAGLAGLCLILRFLKLEKKCITRLDRLGASFKLSYEDATAIHRELYAMRTITRETSKPIEYLKLIKEIKKKNEKTGEMELRYLHEEQVIKGAFLETLDSTNNPGKPGLWVKLWRDMYWTTIRGVPATRKIYERCHEDAFDKDVAVFWKTISTPGATKQTTLSSTDAVGVQAVNAEQVPFMDMGRFYYLLQFWPLVTQVYVPTKIKAKPGERPVREDAGYALVIPDITDLALFVDEFPEMMRRRDEKAGGFFPEQCRIDIPAEAAHETLARLRSAIASHTGGQELADASLAFDIYHLEKKGNNIRNHGNLRVVPTLRQNDEYTRITTAFDRRDCYFRKQLIINLFRDRPWHEDCDRMLATTSFSSLSRDGYFKKNIRQQFQLLQEEYKARRSQMSEANNGGEGKCLETLVYEIVQHYVYGKLKSKHDLQWADVKEKGDDEKQDYDEKKAKLARGAFLAVRSRTGQDFIEFFAGTLCSVGQHVGKEGYADLSRALYQDTERVRTLTMLALAANS